MTEFTPIPGVRYLIKVRGERQPRESLYAPSRPNAEFSWLSLSPEDRAGECLLARNKDVEIISEIYNPHGKVRVEVQWRSLNDDNDGEFEPEVTHGGGCYHWEPFTREEAQEHARFYKEPFVTRTVTTITHATEWTEVTS